MTTNLITTKSVTKSLAFVDLPTVEELLISSLAQR